VHQTDYSRSPQLVGEPKGQAGITLEAAKLVSFRLKIIIRTSAIPARPNPVRRWKHPIIRLH
jgi:hypothetical protein